jgi:hypothetical protein
MRWVAVAAVLALGACVHSTPVSGPDGKAAMLIEGCKSLGTCFEEAAAKCPKGYALMDQGAVLVSAPSPGVFVPNGYGGGLVVGGNVSSSRHHIMVRCSS